MKNRGFFPGNAFVRWDNRETIIAYRCQITRTPSNLSSKSSYLKTDKLIRESFFSTEFIASSVCHEVRLMQRRKQLPPFSLNSPPSSPSSASTSGAETSNSSTPLFTFKQVSQANGHRRCVKRSLVRVRACILNFVYEPSNQLCRETLRPSYR